MSSLQAIISKHPKILPSAPSYLESIACQNLPIPKDLVFMLTTETEKASYSWEKNVIQINPALLHDPTNLLAYILFELLNVSKTEKFKILIENYQSSTDAEKFVEEFERIEHENALEVIEVLERHTKDPFDLKQTFADFSTHYAMQQIQGHAQQIHQKYFPNKPYQGTLVYPLNDLNSKVLKIVEAIAYYILQIQQGNTQASTKLIALLEQIKTSENTICKQAAVIAKALFPKFIS